MKHLYLSIALLLFLGLDVSAQQVTRLKSWGYLDFPPSPVKTFSTQTDAYMISNSNLLKLESNGTLTKLLTTQAKSYTKSSEIEVKTEGNWALFSVVVSNDVYFYASNGTAESTRLVYQYKKLYVQPPGFALLNGHAYILTKDIVDVDLASGTSKVLATLNSYQDYYKIATVAGDLFVTYTENSKYYLARVNLSTGGLTVIADNLLNWDSTMPLVAVGNSLLYWAGKDTTVNLTGSSFQTRRTILQRFVPASGEISTLLLAGYFQSAAPIYLGNLGQSAYFLSYGDFDLKSCKDTYCSGNVGLYLYEVSSQSVRPVKSYLGADEQYTFTGKKQVSTDKIFLEISTKNSGKELWVATSSDMYLVKELNSNSTSLKDYGLDLSAAATCGGNIAIPGFASAATPAANRDNELFVSNGLPNNLYELNIMPSVGVQSTPRGLVVKGNTLFFTATDTIKDVYNLAMTSVMSMDLCNLISIPAGLESTIDVGVKVQQNPVGNKIKLISEESIKKIEVYSMQGQLMHIFKQPGNQIELAMLQKGVYYLNIETESNHYINRVRKIE